MIVEPNKFGKFRRDALIEFENHNEITLPQDYKDFIETYNGGEPLKKRLNTVKNDISWFFSFLDEPSWASFFNAIDVFFDRIPSWYIPIARMEGGDLLIMSVYIDNLGLIANWDHENEANEGEASQYFENLKLVANSFTELLSKLE